MSVTRPPGTTTTVEGPLSDSLGDLVPLLTTFTPPESCRNSWVYDTETDGTVWKDRNYNTEYPIACQPFEGRNRAYRPGVCPTGQEFKYIDVTVEKGGRSSWYVGYCCSTMAKLSYRERFSEYPECFSGLVPPVVATIRDPAVTEDDMSSTTTIGSAVVAIEEPINIIWEESDLTYFPAPVAESFRALMGLSPVTVTTGPESSTASTTRTVSTVSTAPITSIKSTILTPSMASSGYSTSNATVWPDDPDQHIENVSSSPISLSGAAVAGVCVGAVVLLVFLVAIFYFACIRRRRRVGSGDTGLSSGDQLQNTFIEKSQRDAPRVELGEGVTPELQDTQLGSRANPFYISQRHGELQGSAVVAQACTPVELEGSPFRGSGLGMKN